MRPWLLIWLTCLFSNCLIAQKPVDAVATPEKKGDSLLSIIKNSKQDTSKVLTLYQLGKYLLDSNLTDKLLPNGNEILSLSKTLNYKRGQGLGYYILAYYYYKKAKPVETYENIKPARELLEESGDNINYAKSLLLQIRLSISMPYCAETQYYCRIALAIHETLGLKNEIRQIYSHLSTSYYYLAEYPKALEYNLKAQQIAEEIGDQKLMASSLHNIGAVFMAQNDDSMAAEYFNRAIKINKLYPEGKSSLDNNYYALAFIAEKQGRYEEALQVYQNTLKEELATGNSIPNITQHYDNIGSIYEKRGDSATKANNSSFAKKKYGEALENYLTAYQKFLSFYDTIIPVAYAYHVGKSYMKLSNLAQAEKFLQSGLAKSLELGTKDLTSDIYLCLSQADSMAGNYKRAYTNYKLHKMYYDSIYSVENSRLFNLYKSQSDFEKKEKEISLLAAESDLKTVKADKQNQQKKIAYSGIGFLLLSGVLGFFVYRKNQRLIREQEKLNDRLVISQDLHDNIGSTLSSISVYSQVAKIHGKKDEKEDLNELLEKISTTSNEMVTEMNDIVWAINPRNDSMEKIIQRMESFAKPLAAARNIRFNLIADNAIALLQLDMEKRKNFYLIFKEAVTNAIKYSGASELSIAIHSVQNKLVLTVNDNGVGFNPRNEMSGSSSSLSGNGLKNMHARATELNGELTILSQSGKGTAITLQFPLA